MELGGNAPYIVFEDADIDAAVKGAIANKFRNAGQVCVSVNRFYIQETVYDQFVNKLADAVKALKVGNGLDEGVVVGPMIEPAAVSKVREHVEDAVAKGATVLAGGKAHSLGGNFWTPTVLGDCHEDMLLQQKRHLARSLPASALRRKRKSFSAPIIRPSAWQPISIPRTCRACSVFLRPLKVA
jgi:succinate-semialdehyde dehydrogenase/glutarate-semialdehyde dehydrogenase